MDGSTADVTGGKPTRLLSQCITGVRTVSFSRVLPSMEDRERCYSFVLSRTPHETTGIVNSTLDYTLLTLQRSYFVGISANIELRMYSVRCC
jgi:hypothetical protein